MLSQRDQSLGAVGRRVDATEEFLARRFYCCGKGGQRFWARSALIISGRAHDGGAVRLKVAGEHLEELQALLVVHGLVGSDNFLGEGRLRSFSPLGEKVAAHKRHIRTASLT